MSATITSAAATVTSSQPGKAPDIPPAEAEYLDAPAPLYPAMSRRLGEQGRVLVAVLVSATGEVKEASVHTSSGSRRLDEAALAAVKGWKFVPAHRNGVAVEMRYNVPVRFVLEGA